MDNKEEFDEALYKSLYEFQIKAFEDTKAQYARLEDKASKYLTFTSIIIAALSIFSKQYLFDVNNKGIFFYMIVFFIVLIFVSLSCVARFLFHAIEVSEVGRLQTDEHMIDFFVKNELTTVQYNLAKDISRTIKIYDDKNKIKVSYLKRAFVEIKFSGLLLVITVILIVLDSIVL